MNLGADQKKIAILAGLVVVGGYIFYTNVLAGPEVETKKNPAPPAGVVSAPVVGTAPNIGRAKAPVRGAGGREFRRTLQYRPEERPNYGTLDLTLKLDLLAKVQ